MLRAAVVAVDELSSELHAARANDAATRQVSTAARPRIGRTLGRRLPGQSGQVGKGPSPSLTRCPSSEPRRARETCCPRSRLAGRASIALFASLAEQAGYGLVVSPMFEDVGVFERVGESTDIVRKEMYDFRDKSDRHLALRPEGTASVVRAFIEHHPATPWKT